MYEFWAGAGAGRVSHPLATHLDQGMEGKLLLGGGRGSLGCHLHSLGGDLWPLLLLGLVALVAGASSRVDALALAAT